MREDIIKLFKDRNENIGAFCGYLKSKNGTEHKEHIENYVSDELGYYRVFDCGSLKFKINI